jgi:hypothetical protein
LDDIEDSHIMSRRRKMPTVGHTTCQRARISWGKLANLSIHATISFVSSEFASLGGPAAADVERQATKQVNNHE